MGHPCSVGICAHHHGLMIYRNTKTGNTFESPCIVKGKDIEEVKPVKKESTNGRKKPVRNSK